MAVTSTLALRPIHQWPNGVRVLTASHSFAGDGTGGDATITTRLQPARDPRFFYRAIAFTFLDGGTPTATPPITIANCFATSGGAAIGTIQVRTPTATINGPLAEDVEHVLRALEQIWIDPNPLVQGLPLVDLVLTNVNAAAYRCVWVFEEHPLYPNDLDRPGGAVQAAFPARSTGIATPFGRAFTIPSQQT